MEQTMAEPISLTIDLDLDAYLVRHVGYDEDGEERTVPQTLEDVVLGQVVAGLIRQAVHDESTGYKDLRQRVPAGHAGGDRRRRAASDRGGPEWPRPAHQPLR
jgi:hypothetical protein